MKLKRLQEYSFPSSVSVRLRWESPGAGKPEEQTGLAKNKQQASALGLEDWGKTRREGGGEGQAGGI